MVLPVQKCCQVQAGTRMVAEQGGCYVASDHGSGTAGWPYGVGHRLPGSYLSQRYVPTLRVGGQVLTFPHDHRGMLNASPALFEKIGIRIRQAVDRFAEMRSGEVIR
jgi:hypothetical protein